jgi:heme-degrading monooxygenase HmoA
VDSLRGTSGSPADPERGEAWPTHERKGDNMAVKVLIKRRFKKDSIREAYKLLMELRSLATLQTGYVSGETLIGADDPNKLVVISTWISANRWQEWLANPKRQGTAQKMENLLESPEEAEVFLVGDRIPEWVDMA